jgi:purine nucleoside permease
MQAMMRLTLAGAALLSSTAWAAEAPMQPKVMLITMFAPEAQHWIDRLELKQEIRVPGLSAEYPSIRHRCMGTLPGGIRHAMGDRFA